MESLPNAVSFFLFNFYSTIPAPCPTHPFFFCFVAIEGWIVIVRGVHPEADEESLTERFAEYGSIKNLHLNLDRRTGFVKVRIEYCVFRECC
ncbi:hypothetical protein BJV82DRAFT_615909 [Fennellomyces sp. T-0311]|nr:hypothetical protein BJV82DRAFT_615909 [Fennellomyces sp. T-0311]